MTTHSKTATPITDDLIRRALAKLRAARAKGMSVHQLAVLTNTPSPTVYRWVTGSRNISPARAERILRALA